MHNVGIDVAMKELVVAVSEPNKKKTVKTFANTAVGHTALIKYLKPKKYQLRICLEATGTYHFDIAFLLSETDNVELMVVNPRASKNFADALNVKHKTDTADAEILAEYAIRMPFESWVAPGLTHRTVRQYARHLQALTHSKSQTKCQLHALTASKHTPKEIIQSTQTVIEFYEQQIEKLRAEVIKLIRDNEEINAYFERLLSIKGVGEVSAIQIMGELLMLPKDMTIKQWVAFAGLNPRHFQSGSSVSRKPRISKSGNRYLRMALYMPALTATKCDPYVRGYYQHLIEDNGLKKMQALCAVMRKLLHAIYGMTHSETMYDSKRFYRQPANIAQGKESEPLALAA